MVATGDDAGLPPAPGRGAGRRDERPGGGRRPLGGVRGAGAKPVLSAEHARHVVEIMERAVIASQTGQAQDLTTTF